MTKDRDLTEEEIEKILSRYDFGIAGEGDSPYSKDYYEQVNGIKRKESQNEKEPEYEYISNERAEELVAKYNNNEAGRGDSPYTQEMYDKIYDLDKKKKIKG